MRVLTASSGTTRPQPGGSSEAAPADASTEPAGLSADPAAALAEPLAGRLKAVRAILAEQESVLVAFSGGVDSGLLARIAHDVLGRRALACTAVSPSLPAAELAQARALAARIGIRHRVVETHEVELEAYARNAPDRCYVCKGVVFARLREVAEAEGLATLLYGANADDGADFRPGARAAERAGVRAPLAEAGLTKADVRSLARAFGLPNADKPAAPCLASRIPYGQRVTLEKLHQLEAAEAVVRGLGFGDLRVRHHLDVARLEVPCAELPRALDPAVRATLVEELHRLGFRYVTLDLEGLRSGSLNQGLVAPAGVARSAPPPAAGDGAASAPARAPAEAAPAPGAFPPAAHATPSEA